MIPERRGAPPTPRRGSMILWKTACTTRAQGRLQREHRRQHPAARTGAEPGTGQPPRHSRLPAAVLRPERPALSGRLHARRPELVRPRDVVCRRMGRGRDAWSASPTKAWRRSSSACPTWAEPRTTNTARIATTGWAAGKATPTCAFLTDTLKPLVDAQFRTPARTRAHGAGGVVNGRADQPLWFPAPARRHSALPA